MSLRLARVIAIALPLLLTSCAALPPTTPETTGQTAQRRFHETIDIGGRLSVRYQANHREEALHGSFTWSQTPAQTLVALLSPLGQTVAVIDVNAEGATLRQAGQQAKSAANVDALTAETLGWPLPVAGLREWLQGFAVDASGKRLVAAPPETHIDSRDGWRIHYASWLDDNPSSLENRPKRIDLARHTEQAGDVSLRIVIDTWQPR
jgi:outer membrane lipoprotein LolB